ncbi:polysaccharide pyruvyl transferase family protein [Roseitranquillus sediminis]|uniref:polysaccharide pyruvyl transferase family protein n=1 Tax=Roseitranquillus sediminis TaxID=2809051 RepID=UPI001D0C7005|nr:polysaccharide pyruvyl transferase family protein [Roseitranquillus sediminis]MBM9594821.1 polysaccharide pyruvyl transferase family protein [Roseitranquillus sediminis]
MTRIAQNWGLLDGRNMVWSWTDGEPRNFGDWIGPLLYEDRQGRPPLYHKLNDRTGGSAYVTAGSIMGHIKRDDAAIVWGSGIIEREVGFRRPREIRAVRGPMTRARCREQGYVCPDVFGDPAILLPDVLGQRHADVTHELGVIPHFVNAKEAQEIFADLPEVRVIDVTRPVREVVAAILSCSATVSSSLHGLIVSHVYGRPSARVSFGAPLKGDGVKFDDYYLAGGVEIPPEPVRVGRETPVQDLLRLAKEAPVPDNERLKERLLDACPF